MLEQFPPCQVLFIWKQVKSNS